MDMLDENKELTAENLQKLKVADLKKELKSRGLPCTGTKQELISRLESASQNLQNDPSVTTTTTTDNVDTTTEEDNSEEILETAVEGDAEIELTDKKEKGSGGGDSKEDSEHETEGHQVLSLKNLSEAERLQKRAEKFGCLSEDAKKKARAERFGLSQSGKTSQIAGGDGDLDKMKKRAERFGTVLSPALSKVDEEERIRKRKERFKSDEEQRISKRKERFGDVKANDANTKTSTFKYNKITMDSSTDAKKQKRAERFGLT